MAPRTRILIFHPDREFAQRQAGALTTAGFDVAVTDSSAEALPSMRKGSVAVLIAPPPMRVPHVKVLLEAAGEKLPQIVVLTASSEEVLAGRADDLDAAVVLPETVDPGILIHAVKRAAERYQRPNGPAAEVTVQTEDPQEMLERIADVFQKGKELAKGTDTDAMLKVAAAYAADVAGGRPTAVLVLDGERAEMRAAATRHWKIGPRAGLNLPAAAAVPPALDEILKVRFDLHAYYGTPLRVAGSSFGLLIVGDPDGTMDDVDRLVLNQFVEQLQIALSNAVLHQREKTMQTMDLMTEVFNRRYLYDFLRAEVNRTARYNRPLSLIAVDLDGFRAFNEKAGYDAGDRVLTTLSSILRGKATAMEALPSFKLRTSDVVARYGGDDFVVVLPETPRSGAAQKAERLRGFIQGFGFPGSVDEAAPLVQFTVSVGLAVMPEDATGLENLLARTFLYLKEAKDAGGNCIRPDPTDAPK